MTEPTRPPKLTHERIAAKGMFAIGPHVMALDEYIDHLEAEGSIVQACLAGHLGLPLDTSMDDLLTALRGNPRPKRVEPPTKFYYMGCLPDGYEMHVVYETQTEHPDRIRATRMDEAWVGPWRKHGQAGLVTGDAWKHVTQAKNAEIDEAGQG